MRDQGRCPARPWLCTTCTTQHLYHTTKGTGTFWNENVAWEALGKESQMVP